MGHEKTYFAWVTVNFNPDGTIEGPKAGSWGLRADGMTIDIIVDGVEYSGRLLRSFAAGHGRWVMSFTALSEEGIALWGAGVAVLY